MIYLAQLCKSIKEDQILGIGYPDTVAKITGALSRSHAATPFPFGSTPDHVNQCSKNPRYRIVDVAYLPVYDRAWLILIAMPTLGWTTCLRVGHPSMPCK